MLGMLCFRQPCPWHLRLSTQALSCTLNWIQLSGCAQRTRPADAAQKNARSLQIQLATAQQQLATAEDSADQHQQSLRKAELQLQRLQRHTEGADDKCPDPAAHDKQVCSFAQPRLAILLFLHVCLAHLICILHLTSLLVEPPFHLFACRHNLL